MAAGPGSPLPSLWMGQTSAGLSPAWLGTGTQDLLLTMQHPFPCKGQTGRRGSQHHCSKKQLATLLKSDLAHRFNSFSANQSRGKTAKHMVPRAAAVCILSLLLAFTSLL